MLSSTYVKCIWDSKKKIVNELYMPVPISDFCHVEVKEDEDVQKLDTSKSLEKLLKACLNSILAQSLSKVPTSTSTICSPLI